MPQPLKLIKKAERNAPAVYQFGLDKRLNVHLEDKYADLTNAKTGSYICYVGWDGLRELGYSPAKLLAGNESDQFIDTIKPRHASNLKSSIKHIAGGLVAAAVIAIVSNVTGCTNYLANQLNQDIKTSTVYPRVAVTTEHEDPKLVAFREQTAYANKNLRKMNLQASNRSAK